MEKYCLIINNVKKGEPIFTKVKNATLGKNVWYKNSNGNWYRGTIVRELEKVVMPFVPPPNNSRMAITIDCGDITILKNKNELFELQS